MSEKKKKSLLASSPFLNSEISFNEVDITFVLKGKKRTKEWVETTIRKEHKKTGHIAFNFCSDEYLLSVNKQHLNHDYYTDIITFDFCDNNIISGDIYISIDRVKDNAKTQGTSFTSELLRVVIHGVLHLCGYKDKRPSEARQMRQKEDFYLSLLSK